MITSALRTVVLFLALALMGIVPGLAQSNTMQVRIVSVRAVQTTFGLGGDEIFLRASTGARFPAGNDRAQSIDTGAVWTPGARFASAGALTVELLEWDSFNAADLIGSIHIDPSQGVGRFIRSLNGDGAQYDIVYDVSIVQNNTQSQPVGGVDTSRTWAAFGTYADITVADCRDDCEEDIGIILQCQGNGQPALVDVPWLGSDQGPAGRGAPLTINIDGQVFTYDARLGNNGLVGHVPAFTLYPGDPLIEAMQAGHVLQVQFDGGVANIGLKGSRAALDVFKAHCGWNGVAQKQTQQKQTQQKPMLGMQEPFWFATQYNDFETGRLTSALTFGIPETDATGFSASCIAGSGAIGVDMIIDFGTLRNGARISSYIQAQGQTFQFDGAVFVASSEWAGVRAEILADDPVWQAMAGAQGSISYGMIGGGGNTSTAQNLGSALREFLPACLPVPQTQVPQTRVPNTQGSGQPAQPQQGTAARVVNYACVGGTQMWVTFIQSAGGTIASVVQAGNAPVALAEVPSGSGARYSDGVVELATNGLGALLSSPSANLVCQVQ